MKLAIIGVGNVGSALASATVRAGHDVVLAAAHPEHAQEVAQKVGAGAAATAREAVQDADAVILAVPYSAARDVMMDLGELVDGLTVIDVTNPLDESYSDLATDLSATEELQVFAP